MNKIVSALAAFSVLTLSACGGANDTPEAPAQERVSTVADTAITAKYDAILNESFTLEGASETSATDVIALLPDNMKLTIASSAFDAASGATIWTDVSLTGAENENVGVTAEELKLWGLNTGGIAERVAGSNLDETVKLAERIEAKGVSTLGLETMFMDGMVAYIEGVSSTIEAVAPDEAITDDDLAEMRAAMEMVVDEYNFKMGRVVAIAPQMRPWEIKRVDIGAAIESDDAGSGALFLLQEVAAYYRVFGVDHLIWTDTDFSMKMEQDGMKQAVAGGYEFIAYSGWYGGDVDSSVITGIHFDQKIDMAEVFADEGISPEDYPFESMDMKFGAGSGTFTGMKLDKVLRYVAMGEWPPTTDTDLMTYGRFDLQDVDVSLNDADLFSMDQLAFDFSEWHWFIPSKAEISFTGVTYDVSGIMALIASSPEVQDDEEFERVQKAIDIATQYEALPLIFDTTYIWDWSPETGAFSFKTPQKHHKFGQANFEVSGFLPNFEDGVAAVKTDMAYEADPDADIWEERMRETAWEKLVGEKFSVTGGLLVLEDQGGLDKLFPLIAEIAKLDPDEFGPMVANQTPESIRSMAVAGIGFSAIEAGKDMPQAENWIMPFADWVRDGGKFSAKIEPTEPLGASLQEKYPDPTPDEIAEILGITVSHETP